MHKIKLMMIKKLGYLLHNNSLSVFNNNNFTNDKNTAWVSIYIVRDPRNVITSLKKSL